VGRGSGGENEEEIRQTRRNGFNLSRAKKMKRKGVTEEKEGKKEKEGCRCWTTANRQEAAG